MAATYLFAFAAVSAVASAVAALTSLFQARRAAQANEVSVYLRLMEDYGSQEMRDALLFLGQFWRERRETFSDAGSAWVQELEANEPYAREARRHARLVSNYFGSAARLFEMGFISSKLLRLLISRPGLNIYYDIVAPINIRRSPKGHTDHYVRLLKRQVRQYGDGLY
ncbi:MAG TPA: hypothetical protein PLN53_06425 [Terricaulis sp.]|nr:hypothetical protein [Terricaulis sp.]